MPRLGSRVRASFSALKEEILLKDACPGGGMVDALVSGASVERRASSSLVLGTIKVRLYSKLEEWRNW